MKVFPAIVSVPVRDEVLVFAAVPKLTLPLPEPDAPAVTVSQPGLLLTAVHAQPAGAVTATVPVPPFDTTLCEVGEIVSVQVIPACVTVKLLPAIVSVPERVEIPVFAAAVNETEPFPDPEAPDVTVSQLSLLAAVHAHPAGAVTATLPLPPLEATLCEVGEIVSLQVIPACVTVKLLPASVSVPVRVEVDVFADALKLTDPLPEPDAPDVMVSQPELLLLAFHAHPAGAVTAMLPLPPLEATLCDVGEIVSLQVIPACVTVKLLPAIVSVPERVEIPVFAAALNETEPFPDPDAPDVTVSQPSLLAAVHAHPAGAVTATLPLPPVEATLCAAGAIVSVHVMPACVTVKLLPAMVSVPERVDIPVFAAAVNETEPFPDPDAPDVMVSQPVLLLTAVHAHPAGAVTATLPLPPVEATLCAVGAIVSVHVMPACVTVKLLPAIVSVPERVEIPAFAAAVNETEPFPDPDAPDVTVSQPSLLTAVHAHPAGAVTATLPLPPVEAILCDVGEIVSVHVIPACVTVKVLPAIVSVPVRDDVDVLADTPKLTEPFPDPDAPAVTVSQPVLLLTAVQAQPEGAVTATVPVPPPDATLCDVAEIVSVQVIPACVTVKVLPAIVNVPVRDEVDVVAAKLKLTDPLPDPDEPAVTVSQPVLLLTAVQEHPAAAVTETVPVPLLAATLFEVGEIA